jgi:uncharacterized surface protein with fasciclin (FAS1) repeats
MHRILLAVVACVALLVVPAGASASTGSGTGENPGTIVDVAASNPQFSTLVSLVKEAGLESTLRSGEFTVFAPTNAAFRKVGKRKLNALAKDPEKLKAVLTYHVVEGSVPASEVVGLKRAKTVNGKSVRISVRGRNVFLNRSAKVTKTDIQASNGIVHVINRVLIP